MGGLYILHTGKDTYVSAATWHDLYPAYSPDRTTNGIEYACMAILCILHTGRDERAAAIDWAAGILYTNQIKQNTGYNIPVWRQCVYCIQEGTRSPAVQRAASDLPQACTIRIRSSESCALNAHFLRCAMLYTGCGILPVIRLHTSKQICCILYTNTTNIRRDGSSAGRICAGLPASAADFIALSG